MRLFFLYHGEIATYKLSTFISEFFFSFPRQTFYLIINTVLSLLFTAYGLNGI